MISFFFDRVFAVYEIWERIFIAKKSICCNILNTLRNFKKNVMKIKFWFETFRIVFQKTRFSHSTTLTKQYNLEFFSIFCNFVFEKKFLFRFRKIRFTTTKKFKEFVNNVFRFFFCWKINALFSINFSLKKRLFFDILSIVFFISKNKNHVICSFFWIARFFFAKIHFCNFSFEISSFEIAISKNIKIQFWVQKLSNIKKNVFQKIFNYGNIVNFFFFYCNLIIFTSKRFVDKIVFFWTIFNEQVQFE